MEKAKAELLPAVEKAHDLRVDFKKEVLLLEMELSLVNEALSKLKTLEIDFGESVVSERTTECSLLTSKQFETEVVQGFEKIFADIKNEAAKISGGFRTSLS